MRRPIDRFSALVQDHLAEVASDALGLSFAGCRTAVRLAVPAVALGLLELGRRGGHEALSRVIAANSLDVWVTEDLAASLSPAEAAADPAGPTASAAHAVFGDREEAVARALGAETGMDPRAASRLLNAVTLSVAAWLRMNIAQHGESAASVLPALEEERPTLPQLAPPVAAAMGLAGIDAGSATPFEAAGAAPFQAADAAPDKAMAPFRTGTAGAPPADAGDAQVDRLAARLAAAFEASKHGMPHVPASAAPAPAAASPRRVLISVVALAAMTAALLWLRADVPSSAVPAVDQAARRPTAPGLAAEARAAAPLGDAARSLLFPAAPSVTLLASTEEAAMISRGLVEQI